MNHMKATKKVYTHLFETTLEPIPGNAHKTIFYCSNIPHFSIDKCIAINIETDFEILQLQCQKTNECTIYSSIQTIYIKKQGKKTILLDHKTFENKISLNHHYEDYKEYTIPVYYYVNSSDIISYKPLQSFYEEQCPICFDSISQTTDNQLFLCGHFIHKDCLQSCCSKSRCTKCPVCRTSLLSYPEFKLKPSVKDKAISYFTKIGLMKSIYISEKLKFYDEASQTKLLDWFLNDLKYNYRDTNIVHSGQSGQNAQNGDKDKYNNDNKDKNNVIPTNSFTLNTVL